MKNYHYLFIIVLFFTGSTIHAQVKKVSASVIPVVGDGSLLEVEGPIAEGKSKFLGCAYSSGQAVGFQDYWNQVTPENGGKWGSVEGTHNVMNWISQDAAYTMAKKYGLPFKEHTLIWGSQQPSWMASLDTTSQRKEIEQWFALLAARYPDMEYIDVVNEPLHNAPNGMTPWGSTTKNIDYANALGGAGVSGWDWIIRSFRLARFYFPNSKLILNEYSVINNSTETRKYIQIINLLKAESLIDGIGEQAHAFTTAGTSTATLKANLDALAATGIPIYLTEMDIDGSTDLVQLKEMQRVFSLFWEHPGVKGITLWGFRVGLWRNDQGAYLINQSGAERPALKWLRAYVGETLVKTESISVMASDNSSEIHKLGATLNMQAQVLPADATIANVSWTVTPSYRATIDANGVLTALTTGTVNVTATAWDGSGVTGSKVITITNDATGVDDMSLTDLISVYPNPAFNGCFTVNGIASVKQIDLYSLVGKKVKTFSNSGNSSLNICTEVPPGIYLLNFNDGKSTSVKKIIIR